MRKTSFGFMEQFQIGDTLSEYLEFYKSGRPHKHQQKEVFKILEGSCLLNIEGEESLLLEGEVASVPVNKKHYMVPKTAVCKVILYYVD